MALRLNPLLRLNKKRLAGERVRLRKISALDVNELMEYVNDEAVKDFTYFKSPFGEVTARNYILACQKEIRKGESLNLGIELLETGKIIGMVSLLDISWIQRRGEIQYWIGAPYRGKGLAKEAITLMLKFAFERMSFNRIFAITNYYNETSCALLEKFGFKKEGTLRKHTGYAKEFVDSYIYGLLYEEWQS